MRLDGEGTLTKGRSLAEICESLSQQDLSSDLGLKTTLGQNCMIV